MANNIETFHQVMSDSITLNLNLIESQYGIKLGCKFIQQRSPNINLYSDIRPYRVLGKNHEEVFDLNQKIGEGDFLGDIKLQRSQFSLVTFMKATRQYLYRKIYFNERGLDDEFIDKLREELKKVINIWMFGFDNYTDEEYRTSNSQAFLIDESDLIYFYPIHSFLIEHEVGHIFYNIFLKDVYNGGFTGNEFNLKAVENIMESFLNARCMEIEHRDRWIEELVADLFAYQMCCRIKYPNQVMPSFLLSIYGISFALIILVLNNKYYNKMGFDDTPGTHPDHNLRLNSLDSFADTVNTGKYPDEYRLTKNVIQHTREAVSFIELLIKEI